MSLRERFRPNEAQAAADPGAEARAAQKLAAQRGRSTIAAAPAAGKAVAGVLTLRAPGALAPFLQQQAPLLIERLKLAGAKVKSVRIEQRAAARPAGNVAAIKKPLSAAEETALAKALDHVGDPALKSALLRLGRAVKQG